MTGKDCAPEGSRPGGLDGLYMRRYFLCAAALWAVDRAAKLWAVNDLSARPDGRLEAIGPLMRFQFARNTGAAFSAFAGNTLPLTLVTALLVVAVAIYLWRGRQNMRAATRAGLAMVLAGGLGNLYDRIVHGYVIDYIELTFVRFAIFNAADVFICAGAALCVIGLLLPDKRTVKRDGVDG